MIKSATNPVVLVLLASYNGSEWLMQQLNSIIRQKNVSLKILVRDDKSTDDTKSTLRKFERSYHFLSCIYAEKSSCSAGANFRKLILSSDLDSVDYVAFCDQDDIWFDDKLISSIKALESSDSVGFSSSVIAFWSDGKKKKLDQSDKITDIDFLFEGAGQGCTFLMTKEFFSIVKKCCRENQKLFDTFYYHDWLVYLIARSLNKTWCFSNKPTILYRQHGGNETGSRVGLSAYLKRFSMIKSGWYKKQIDSAIDIINIVAISKSSGMLQFESRFKSPNNPKRRVMLAVLLLKSGRRRISDRLVLALSAVMGYI
jgi:rhamnosyltransferase